MCLDSLDSSLPDTTEAYKVFRTYPRMPGGLYALFIETRRENTPVYEPGVQYTSQPSKFSEDSDYLTIDDGKRYPIGFHCFYTYEDAQKYVRYLWHTDLVIRKILAENIVAKGYQKGYNQIIEVTGKCELCQVPVFVCRHITITADTAVTE